ncbi:hypothetical protein THAOC_18357, partial [Thalassiosira oceanica]
QQPGSPLRSPHGGQGRYGSPHGGGYLPRLPGRGDGSSPPLRRPGRAAALGAQPVQARTGGDAPPQRDTERQVPEPVDDTRHTGTRRGVLPRPEREPVHTAEARGGPGGGEGGGHGGDRAEHQGAAERRLRVRVKWMICVVVCRVIFRANLTIFLPLDTCPPSLSARRSNYVVQKLYEFGTPAMKRDLKGTLDGNMLLLSLQMYGCRVVQKALESLQYDDLCELLEEFRGNTLTCIQDQNGNHVIQKLVEVMSIHAKNAELHRGEAGLAVRMADRIQFVVDDVLANVRTLCCHPYGCRVLQRMLEHCVEFQKMATLDRIQGCHRLLDDMYANYVIQHILQYGRDSDRDSLLKIIVENDLLKLSRQKFASNVIEKLLKYGNAYQRNTIVREMLKVANEGTSQEGVGSTVLLLMVRDAYANYVVQTAIDVVPEGQEKRMLLDELKANEVQLVGFQFLLTSLCVVGHESNASVARLFVKRNYTFAKHIVAKLGPR